MTWAIVKQKRNLKFSIFSLAHAFTMKKESKLFLLLFVSSSKVEKKFLTIVVLNIACFCHGKSGP